MAHEKKHRKKRFAFGMMAIVIAALACRQGQPANDPKPAPNTPLPTVDRPDEEPPARGSKPPPLKPDAG